MAFVTNPNVITIGKNELGKMGRGQSPLQPGLEVTLAQGTELEPMLGKQTWTNDETGKSGEFPVLKVDDKIFALGSFRTKSVYGADGKAVNVTGFVDDPQASYLQVYEALEKAVADHDVTLTVNVGKIAYGIGQSMGSVKTIIEKK